MAALQPRTRLPTPPVWAPPLSLAATRGITVVFSSSGYLDVSVPRVRPRPSPGRVPRLQRGGLPHSDTRGSRAICASPRIFAACHVLLRLRKPRHPPSALLRFSFVFSGEGDFIMSRLRSFVSRLLHFYGRHPPACPKGMPGGLPHLYPGRLTAPPPVHYVNDLYIARPGMPKHPAGTWRIRESNP